MFLDWSLDHYVASLSSVTVFILKSILSEMNIVTPPLFWFPFAWNTFFHLITFSLYVSLSLKLVSCRQHIYGCCFCICSASLCLLSHAFNPFTFKVIIDMYVSIAISLIILFFYRSFLVLSSFVLLWFWWSSLMVCLGFSFLYVYLL